MRFAQANLDPPENAEECLVGEPASSNGIRIMRGVDAFCDSAALCTSLSSDSAPA
jgi:hypothetical protein